ncbi:MAG: ABC transporter permease [Elusimicrobia bacterium]|nr:ABC transporter permease [Elusimicrobiota bacterium]MBU2615017.1 ABC transporter permease [Elusimicrobiota bacterium]
MKKDKLFSTAIYGFMFFYPIVVLSLIIADISYVNMAAIREVFHSQEIMYALKLSVISSTISIFFALVFGVPCAYALSRYKFSGKAIVDTIVDIPVFLPYVVIGLSLLIFFQTPVGRFIEKSGLAFVYTSKGIVLCQTIVACAYVIRTVRSTFDTIDYRAEDVAKTLGCSDAGAFFKITIPNARNGIIAGGVLGWAVSFGLFGPVVVFCGITRFKTEVLPSTIFLEVSVGRLEVALTVSLLMITIALASLVLFKKFGNEKSK